MYFTELIVKAFGLHESVKVKFTQGLNVLVGESETGKTTLIRALYLLIENQPRAGEKLYHNWDIDDPVDIQLTTNKGDTVRRKDNKYYLNDGRPLKAFGSSVPEPIRQLFNFKEINWQRQMDIHYLLFSTGGKAARLLNKATGLSDQEIIIADIKENLSKSKSEIKRLKKNNHEHQQTIERLKNVTRYKIKIEAVLYIKEEAKDLQLKANKLENILVQLQLIEEIKMDYNKLKPYRINLNKIFKKFEEVQDFKEYVEELRTILTKIEETHTVDPDLVLNYLETLQTLHSRFSENSTMLNKTILLERLLADIETTKKIKNQLTTEIKQDKKEIDNKFIELGYCPFCNRKVKDGDTCSC